MATGQASGWYHGALVRVRGLIDWPDLDGQAGSLDAWDDARACWRVLFPHGSTKLIRHENLEFCSATDSARPPGSPPRRIWKPPSPSRGSAEVAVLAGSAPCLPNFGGPNELIPAEMPVPSQESASASQESQYSLADGFQMLTVNPGPTALQVLELVSSAPMASNPFTGLSEAVQHAETESRVVPGYASGSVGVAMPDEAMEPGMADHAQHTMEQALPDASVSQSSVVQGHAAQRLRNQTVHQDPPSRSEGAHFRRQVRPRRERQEPWRLLTCTMCQGADAFQARDSRGLMQHMVRSHLGQPLLAETVAQLRALDKVACRICASIRSDTDPRCRHCNCATATRPLQLGDSVPDRRRGQQTQASQEAGGSASQPVPPDGAEGIAEEDASSRHTIRVAHVSDASMHDAQKLRRVTLWRIPVSVASRMAACAAEALQGALAGVEMWGFLARFRSRLLLAHVAEGEDRVTELRRRLDLWEQGRFDELVQRISGQQLEEDRRALHRPPTLDDEDHRGKMTRQRTAAGAKSKAVKSLVGGIAPGSATERRQWTIDLVPRHEGATSPCTRQEESALGPDFAWGRAVFTEALKEMRQAGRRPGSHDGIPWARLAPWRAPGPSGDRQEHLDDMLQHAGASVRRRLVRVLDELTVRWAINTLPSSCRWLLNTQVLFLTKAKEPACKHFDDEEWLDSMCTGSPEDSDADDEANADVAAEDVVGVGQEVDSGDNIANAGGATEQAQVSPGVRPIQIGEFLRRWVSKRLLQLNKCDISKVMVSMRQLGVGTSGGAEALATFHQLIYELWHRGELPGPLARVKIDEKNCFGRLTWPAVREAAKQHLPKHFPVACWKHAEVSGVEQSNVEALSKDRGAEQGDVDGPLECSLTLGVVARTARGRVHALQRERQLPWCSHGAAAEAEAAADFDLRNQHLDTWEGTSPPLRREAEGSKSILPSPADEVQRHGGIADFWYMDDGDALCHPSLVRQYLQLYDEETAKAGGQRNKTKTEVVFYASEECLNEHAAEWHLEEVRQLATVSLADAPGLTLGIATGSLAGIETQLQTKVDVVCAMHERVAVANDVQTEHMLDRECLGVGRVNHILRVHGDVLRREGGSLASFDEATRREMDRLFPGLTAEGHEQGSLAQK